MDGLTQEGETSWPEVADRLYYKFEFDLNDLNITSNHTTNNLALSEYTKVRRIS